jgi:hypothetical protein
MSDDNRFYSLPFEIQRRIIEINFIDELHARLEQRRFMFRRSMLNRLLYVDFSTQPRYAVDNYRAGMLNVRTVNGEVTNRLIPRQVWANDRYDR